MDIINVSLTIRLQREIRQNRQLLLVYEDTINDEHSPYHTFKKRLYEAKEKLFKLNELLNNISLN